MAFPTVAARETSGVLSDPTPDVALPAGIVAGNLLIAVVAYRSGTSGVSWPAGWTPLFETNHSLFSISVAYRIADGSEGATVTPTLPTTVNSAHATLRITGASTTTAPAFGVGVTGSQHPDPPSLAPAGGAKDFLWLAVCGYNTNAAPTAPTNYGNLNHGSIGSGTSSGASTATAERQLNAASENSGTFGMAVSTLTVANTIAVFPAPELRDASTTIAIVGTLTVAASVATVVNAAVAIALQSTVSVASGLVTYVNAAVGVALSSAVAIGAGIATYVNAAVAIALSSTVSAVANLASALVSRATKWMLVGVWVDPESKTTRGRWRKV